MSAGRGFEGSKGCGTVEAKSCWSARQDTFGIVEIHTLS